MRISQLVFLFVFGAIASLGYSSEKDTSEIKSEEFQAEHKSFKNMINQSRKEFADAMSGLTDKFNLDVNKLKSEHLVRLNLILKKATQSGDLDEALKMRDAIKALQESIVELPDLQKQTAASSAKIVELEKRVAELTQAKAAKENPGTGQAIVGTWRWFDGQNVVFKANGEAECNLKGQWRKIEGTKNSFSVSWSSGSIDTVTLSDEGKLLEGKTNNHRVWAVRLK